MKTRTALSLAARRDHAASRRGVALLLVLGCLVLLTTLILAFLISGQSNLKSSKLYANGSSVKTLADSTVNIVMAQIQQATSNGTQVAWASQPGMIRTYSNTGAPLNNFRLYSWDSPVASGAFDPNTDETQISNVATTPWYSSPSVFVDLNAPVADSTGTPHYPIIDGNPSDFASYSGPATANVSVNTYTPYNATYNGATVSVPQIDGFWVTPSTAAATTGTTAAPPTPAGPAISSANLSLSTSTTANLVPMPVKWLYVLQDGTVVAPKVGSSGTSVTIKSASVANPIVGRIAYWTDDETAKVNINTASEGNFADTPRTVGATDFDLAGYPTAQNEFQRYPGHPAMTCLSTVFGSIWGVDHSLAPPSFGSYYTAPATHATYAPYQPYFDLAPKLNTDSAGNLGSQAGTVTAANTTPLTTKGDRLFATVDELMFNSNLFTDSAHTASATPTGTSGSRPLVTANSAFNQTFLEKAKFFLTASSRAPDVNLFNQPRVVTWPINSTTGAAYQTAFDQAIAFCGQIGKANQVSTGSPLPYYFQRSRSDHPTVDLPPGPYTAGDVTLNRNRALINYLENLTAANIPGFGGNFLAKYPNASGTSASPTDRDQILTEIFDYIRCLDLIDVPSSTMTNPFAPVSATYANTTGHGTASTLTAHAGEGSVVPIYDTQTNTKGFGRYPTISEASLMFIATGWNDGTGGTNLNDVNQAVQRAGGNPNVTIVGSSPLANAAWGYYNDGTNGQPATSSKQPPYFTIQPNGTQLPIIPGGTSTTPAGNIQVQAMLILNFFDPSQGYLQEHNTQRIQILGLNPSPNPNNSFMWGSTSASVTSMGFPDQNQASPLNSCTTNMNAWWGGGVPEYTVSWGGNLGFRNFFMTEQAGQLPSSANFYPFFSTAKNFTYTPDKTAAQGGGGTFYFSGGDITVNVLLPSQTANFPPTGWPSTLTNPQTSTQPPIQTIKITFPAATLPLPTMASAALNNKTSLETGSTLYQDRGYWNYRLQSGDSNMGGNPEFITAQDVVRSVRAFPGDMRIIAATPVVTDTVSSAATGAGYFDSVETKIQASNSSWNYFSSATNLVHSLRESLDFPFGGALLGQLVPLPTTAYAGQQSPTTTPFPTTYASGLIAFSSAGNAAGLTGALMYSPPSGGNPPAVTTIPGDWDNGISYTADGPYINKPDEGDYNFTGTIPYFGKLNTTANVNSGQTFFSPNRLMSGPGMFGSLPTGVIRNLPWQTLLFCPNSPASISHPGNGTLVTAASPATAIPSPGTTGYSVPPDHLFLDLFNMPVVEPYPITEPLSTSGRINMNYQIVPFSYIERQTGLRAVLKSELMTVIPDSRSGHYKQGSATAATNDAGYDYRVPINADQTLLAFDNYFATNKDIFRSASQICTMYLYPQRDALMSLVGVAGPLWDSANKNILNFWNGNLTGANYTVSQTPNPSTTTSWPTHYLTGDNSHERPYADIYPRLTTKSNTFTVHYYVQTLQKITGSDPTLWTENKDVVTGEYRGSTTIERYVDPADASLPDFTTGTAAITSTQTGVALDSFYKFRVINTKQFAP